MKERSLFILSGNERESKNEANDYWLYSCAYWRFRPLRSTSYHNARRPVNSYTLVGSTSHLKIYPSFFTHEYNKTSHPCSSHRDFTVIWDLLAGQISCSAELSMKKSFITSCPGYPFDDTEHGNQDVSIIWAVSCKNMSSCICEQGRPISAYAPMQSDQDLHWLLIESHNKV